MKLWFGKEEEVDIDANNIELTITTYDKQLGDLFYIPKKICKYLSSCGVVNPEKTLKDINVKHVKRSYKIYKKRVKEQANIFKIEEIKKEIKRKQKEEKRERERSRKEREKKERTKQIQQKKNKNKIIINDSISDTNKTGNVEVAKVGDGIGNTITDINYKNIKHTITFKNIKKIFKIKKHIEPNQQSNKIIINIENKVIKRKSDNENNNNYKKLRKDDNKPL